MTLGKHLSTSLANRKPPTSCPTTARLSRSKPFVVSHVIVGAFNQRAAVVRNVVRVRDWFASGALVFATIAGSHCAVATAPIRKKPAATWSVSAESASTLQHAAAFGGRSCVACSDRFSISRINVAKFQLPEIIQDLLYAEDHRLLDDAVGRAAKRAFRLGVADSFVLALIQDPVRKHKIAQAFAGPFRLPQLSEGSLILGIDLQENPVVIPVQYLNGHTLTIGGTGCGKTTRSLFLVLQVAPHMRGVWLFDLRKREYAILQPYLARLGIELLVVAARQLKINPMQVPAGVTVWDWAPRVADMLEFVLSLPSGASRLISKHIQRLYLKTGVESGSRAFPTLFDLREAVAADKEAFHSSRKAFIEALDPILMSLHSVLCYRFGWTTADLAKHRIVFEFGGVGEREKSLLLNTLVLSEFTSRIAQGISNQKLNLGIFLDEAGRMVSASGTSSGVADLIGLIRGTGIGLDLSAQSTDVAHAILSNTANKFLGRCGSAADYDSISAAMGLPVEQRRFLSTNLVPGLFVGQVGEGNWRHPFLFRVPQMRFDAGARATVSTDLGNLKLLESIPV